ncbi:hypothetical protein L249_2688 [Ophiocordyceps polyrhachis-furcata BCC 54312]|uniref:Transcription factor domain-containing protein n=1 Tax=Ophiocordyceps polyrhachis-furcata BCC 54312 TaxID=1330021 RepID=A0A367LRY9_9HYPO|nr:hypothetical protein L249_2688 [Ophiocordyceps polyrhachis-furcata BCC 54312]
MNRELTSTSPAFSPPQFSSFSPTCPRRPPPSHLSRRARYPLPPPPPSGVFGAVEQQTLHNVTLESPFKDCVGSFGNSCQRRFARPIDGKVNGYIKFNWRTERSSRRESQIDKSTVSHSPQRTESLVTAVEDDSPTLSVTPFRQPSVSSTVTMALSPELDASFDFSGYLYESAVSCGLEIFTAVPTSSTVRPDNSCENSLMGAPRKVPQLFGMEAKMDHTDRKLFTFYIRNWCPGRSVLADTNLWLKDFAQMHKSDGVLAAIQSLAGIYIYDYKPLDIVRKRVNDRFFVAESRLSRLLNDPSTRQNEAQANELITIAVLLSMQDIVLTERRLQKPCDPRWLAGFKHGELFLQETDQGSRFWNSTNAQLSSLRVSQSVIVGRAMILAQPMMKLPPAETFVPEYETSRFGWLLYGTERDMYQIHGGCGFSRKLLHIFSQITYCAARLQQDPTSIVVPTTSQYLHTELSQMRQWSSESKDWEAAKAGLSVTEWARSVPVDYVVSSSADMTDVTAEAWRLTAIIYLQCRVWRLPRNHPAVVASLSDLARCIQIMPTSGYHFTAQAPLFPVFLLGMLSVRPELRNISKTWFDEVVSTPVRSSVPPLYEALQRIWQWIDVVVPPLPPTVTPLNPIGLRCPWWEQVVHEVDMREEEVLCLT